MKIFYAIQATGNGHISRAAELYPYLQKYGEVDFYLSGSNYGLKTQLPIAYRSRGLSLAYNQANGSVDIRRTFNNIKLRKLIKEAKQLPLHKYDLILNDFEFSTSLACMLKGLPSIHVGHQASFQSRLVPRPPSKDIIGEWILKHFVRSEKHIGFHFKQYDTDIYPPVIKTSILRARPSNEGHITVYLSQYSDQFLFEQLSLLTQHKFHVFSSRVESIYEEQNVTFFPVNGDLFSKSMILSQGVITGAGFETPAEALYLNKKLMVIPLKGQYEQKCNAAALLDYDVTVLERIDGFFATHFTQWIHDTNPILLDSVYPIPLLMEKIFGCSPARMDELHDVVVPLIPKSIMH
ncbi:MAG: hypothetical protein RL131_216 [Bacteroidota bacterium]